MKRIVAIAVGFLALLVAAMSYNVWRASQEPVTSTPGPLETGRMHLHAQLEDARKIESQAEKQGWDSPAALRELIKGHEQRIEKLAGNSQAAEIVAYDRESINRLEKRIGELAEQQAARAAQEAAATRAAGIPAMMRGRVPEKNLMGAARSLTLTSDPYP